MDRCRAVGLGRKNKMAHSKYRFQNTETSDVRPQRAGPWTRLFLCLMLATVITVAASVRANAQSASFRSVDTNRDGVLSYSELVTQFGRAGADRLIRQLDRNRDSILTIQELRQRGDDDDDDDDRATPGDNGRNDPDDDDDRDDDGGGDDGGDDDGGGGDDGGGDDGGDDD